MAGAAAGTSAHELVEGASLTGAPDVRRRIESGGIPFATPVFQFHPSPAHFLLHTIVAFAVQKVIITGIRATGHLRPGNELGLADEGLSGDALAGDDGPVIVAFHIEMQIP